MDLAELIAASSDEAEVGAPDPRSDPTGALDFHRRQFPRNQRVVGGALPDNDKSDRVRLRGVIEQLMRRDLIVSGIEMAHYQQGAQVKFLGTFDRRGQLPACRVVVDGVDELQDTLREVQEVLQNAGLHAVVTTKLDIALIGTRSGEDEVRYVEAGGGQRVHYGHRSPSTQVSPEQLLAWNSVLPHINDQLTIRRWLDAGYTPEKVLEWYELGLGSLAEVKHWNDLGQTPEQARAWRDLGLSVYAAIAWLHAGLTPADAAPWTAVGIIDYGQAHAWASEGFSPQQAKPWVKIGSRNTPDRLRALLDAGVGEHDAQALADAELNYDDLRSLVRWVGRYRIKLDEAIAWAALGQDFIGPVRRGRWHKAGFTPDQVRLWQKALNSRAITLEQVQALQAEGFDPQAGSSWEAVHPSMSQREIFEPWLQAGLAPAAAEPWIALHESFVSYSRVAPWAEAGLTPDDAAPWARQAAESDQSQLCDYEVIKAWQDAHPRCQDPALVARLIDLTTPHQLPQLLALLA